ncbi:MAG TPA: hypothetical protein VFI62_07215, partial [Burkholderiales bacterium]|nr:hypothetical protein [Burkholderiales bacterium]
MAHTLQSFSAQCRDILKAENNPAGRAKVAKLLQEALKDESFIAGQFKGDNAPERNVLYEDSELGFCILAH